MIQQDSANQSKKRRFTRVSRACVECRARKVRCNARQPCEACEDFNRRCVYSSTKAQRTGGAPRTKILEDRLRKARNLISQLQAEHPSIKHQTEIDAIFDTPPSSPESVNSQYRENDPRVDLENMMDGQGTYTAINENSPIYYGGMSGFTFLERTQRLFSDGTASEDSDDPAVHDPVALSHLFDTPLPDRQALFCNVPIKELLPTRSTTTRLLGIVFEQTHQLLRFIDVPWFHAHTERIYDMNVSDYADTDHDFLPLFLGVVAIGFLFDPRLHKKHGCSKATEQAMRHFIAARQMADVTKCHDSMSLQVLIVFSMFLMSTARLATAHTYIALAAAAAMRLGLHSQTTYGKFTDRENISRQRLLWTIVKLDIYTCTVLGLPVLVNLSHVDQVRPSGRIDDYKYSPETTAATRDQQRILAASAQYRDLLLIISGMTQKLFPKTEQEAKQVRKSKRMLISNAVIADSERQLREWREALPMALDVNREPESPVLKSVMFELEMAHNLGLILLYRPFLHYLARTRSIISEDHRQLKCASACIKVARETIMRSKEMLEQGLLAPTAWQSVYTVFLSVVVLIFYLATQKSDSDYDLVASGAESGIAVLASTSCQDIGSRRCLDVLKVLTRRLSHIIHLDIEKIERNTTLFCQLHSHPEVEDFIESHHGRFKADYFSESPHDDHQPNGFDSSTFQQQSHTMPQTLNVDDDTLRRVVSHPQHTSHALEQSTVRSHSLSTPAFAPINSSVTGTGTSSHDATMSHAYSMDDYLMPQQDMEVPYSGTFAWPFDANNIGHSAGMHMGTAANDLHMPFNLPSTYNQGTATLASHPALDHFQNQAILEGGQMVPGSETAPPYSHGHGPCGSTRPRMPATTLTSEDIAAFMMHINPAEEPFL